MQRAGGVDEATGAGYKSRLRKTEAAAETLQSAAILKNCLHNLQGMPECSRRAFSPLTLFFGTAEIL